MSDREATFRVNFVVNRTAEEAAQDASKAGYKEIEKQADATAKKVGQAAQAEARARKKAAAEALTADQAAARAKEELIRRENAATIKALADAQDARKKALADAKRAAREATDAERQAARERVQAARQEYREKREQLRQARADERSANKQAVQERRDRAKAEKQAAKETAEAERQVNAQIKATTSAGMKAVGVLTSFGGAITGISGVADALRAIPEALAKLDRQFMESEKFVEGYRDALKELAFLKGQPGGTGAVVAADLDFRAKTLQDQGSARAVQEEFRNMAGVSIDSDQTRRKMTEADALKAMEFAGQLQSVYGGDAGSYGKLAGMIPSLEKKDRVSAEDVNRRMAQLVKISEKGGATPGQFAEQLAASAALTTTGAYKDIGRQAAVGSTISLETPREISTAYDQLHRLTTGSLSDMTAPPSAKMKPAEYLKSIGATDQMDDLEILQRMMADAEREEAKAKAEGKELNLTTYLKDRGYANIQDMGRFTQVYGRRKDLAGTFLPLAGGFDQAGKFQPNLPTAEEAQAPFNQYKLGHQGMTARSNVVEDKAKFAEGAGAMEYYEALRRQAYGPARLGGDVWGSYDEAKDGFFSSRALDSKMREILRQEGMARGMDLKVREYNTDRGVHREDPLDQVFTGRVGSKELADQYYQFAQKLAEKKGDPLGENSQIMKDFADQTKRAADALTKIETKLAPAPVAVIRAGGVNAGGPAR